jgi:hypothetical protein
MANREIAYRVADQIEKSETFSMAQQFHADGQPSCIAGHILADAGDTTRHIQPDIGMEDIGKLQRRLGIDFITAMMLCMPLRRDAHVHSLPGSPGYISKERAAAQLRRVGDGEYPDWDLVMVDGKLTEKP